MQCCCIFGHIIVFVKPGADLLTCGYDYVVGLHKRKKQEVLLKLPAFSIINIEGFCL